MTAFDTEPTKLASHFEVKTEDVATRLREIGFEPPDLYYRHVSRRSLPRVIQTGTNRRSDSQLYHDDQTPFESDGRYEELAMMTHDIEDRRFTTYLHDAGDMNADTLNAVMHKLAPHQMGLFYRKDPGVIPIDARKLNPKCAPQSGGFALFKDEPLKFLVGVVVDRKFYTVPDLTIAAPVLMRGIEPA